MAPGTMLPRRVSKAVEHVIRENHAANSDRFEVHIKVGNALHFVSRHSTNEAALKTVEVLEATSKKPVTKDKDESEIKGKRKERVWLGKEKTGLSLDQAQQAQALRKISKPEYTWVVEPVEGKAGRFMVAGYK